jgi:AcrR family transcriptional regulator
MFNNIVQTSKKKYLSFEQRHKEILDSAISLFNTKGYRATTTAALAEASGISEPILYKHFKNKKELFLECFRCIMKDLVEEYRKARKEYRGDEIGYLTAVTNIYISYVDENPHKSKFLIHLLSYRDNPEFENVFNKFMQDSINDIEEIINSAKKKGTIKSNLNSRLLAGVFVTQYFTIVALQGFVEASHLSSTSISELIKDMMTAR